MRSGFLLMSSSLYFFILEHIYLTPQILNVELTECRCIKDLRGSIGRGLIVLQEPLSTIRLVVKIIHDARFLAGIST